jgi:sedoheptulokinase
LVLNLGTGGQVSIPDCTGNFVEGFETRPMPHGGFIHVGASLCGGWSYAYLKNFCGDLVKSVAGIELSDEELYAKINQLAAGAVQNNSVLLVDTRFAGVRGDSSVRGKISGIDTTNFNISNLAYAFLEGMVSELKNMAMPMLAGKHRVVASGNAVRKNSLMPAIIAKIFGMDCAVSVSHEEAAIGAAAAAALELGLCTRADINSCLRNA